MKIQKPVISQPTITNAGSLTGAGANLTGSFSGAMDISSFDGNAATTISGSTTTLSASIASDVATNTAKLTANTSNVTSAGAVMDSEVTSLALIKGLTATTISGSLGANATLIRSLTAANVTGSTTALSASLSARHVTAEAFKTSFDAAIGLSSDDVTILGDLVVQGTTTELQVATLNVEDKNITVSSGSADSAAADGAGLTVAGAGATFTYSHSGTQWNMNKALDMGANTITTTGAIAGATLNTGQGANELYAMDQDVETTDAVTFASVNTGQGANELYAMNQDVETTDAVTFATVNTGQGANELYAMDQPVLTTSDVQFNDVHVDSLGIGTAASGTSGEIRATGDITAFYSSDERLKENLIVLDGALDKVNQMNGYEFDWKEGIEDIVSKKGHDIGVKAQEVQALYPELVHERDNGYLAVDYVKLTAVLIQAVKELSAKVDELSK
tara:strand:- start:6766 stop:8106 length:1341 start_codon:yes stop_codon:yes gene_type:complete